MNRNTTQINVSQKGRVGKGREFIEGFGFSPRWKLYHQFSLFHPPPSSSAQPPLCSNLIFFHLPGCQRSRLPTPPGFHRLL